MMSFWNLELDMLSYVKTTGKYWLNFVVLTPRYKNKTVLFHDTIHQTSLGDPGVGHSGYWLPSGGLVDLSGNNAVLLLYVE